MFTLVAPMLLDRDEDVLVLTELEHSEQESEGEELSIEWDDTTLGNSLELFKGSDEWHAARGVNIDLHERLDASRLLDPPDARIGLA